MTFALKVDILANEALAFTDNIDPFTVKLELNICVLFQTYCASVLTDAVAVTKFQEPLAFK